MSDEQFEVGFMHGHAIAYDPSSGHIAVEPLRSTAKRLERVGLLVAGADLLAELEYVDSRPHVAGKIAKKLKKAVSKVKTVAKKVAASKLGKVVKFAAAAVNPAAGAALLAISAGKKVAKAAKKKPNGPAAKKTAPIAKALAKKKITPKQATAKAKRAGVSPTQVKQTAVALRVQDAANEGNPAAQQLLATSNAMDAAQASPAPLSIAPSSPYGGGGGGGGGELPDPFGESYDDGGESFDADSLADTNPLAEPNGGELPDPYADADQGDGEDYDQGEGDELEPYDQTDEYEA